jgi:hypothetical protein
MSYNWWKLIHLLGVVGFMAAHGTSMAATLLIRRIRDPQRVSGVLQLSATTTLAFYVSTLVLLVGGIGAGIKGSWFGQGWIWLSLGLLVAVGILMGLPMSWLSLRLQGWGHQRPHDQTIVPGRGDPIDSVKVLESFWGKPESPCSRIKRRPSASIPR